MKERIPFRRRDVLLTFGMIVVPPMLLTVWIVASHQFGLKYGGLSSWSVVACLAVGLVFLFSLSSPLRHRLLMAVGYMIAGYGVLGLIGLVVSLKLYPQHYK